MKVLVTGVKGQLGYDCVNELRKRGHEAVGVDIEEMDITDAASVNSVIRETNPDAVIHCAAWTAVDAAEEEDNKEKVRRFQREIEYIRCHWEEILKEGDPCYNKNLSLTKWNYSLKPIERLKHQMR